MIEKKNGDAKGAVAVSCGQVLGDWWAGGGLEQPAPDQDHDQQILDISWQKYLKLIQEKIMLKRKTAAPDQDHHQQILNISWHKYLTSIQDKSCCKK